MKKWFLLFSVILLQGCASSGLNIAKDYELNDTKGVIFLSVRHDPISACDKPAPLFAYIHKSGKSPIMGLPLNIHNTLLKTDFKKPDGYFYIHDFEPGRYFISHNDFSRKSNGVEKKIRYQFDIRPGKATYLGELTFRREHRNAAKRDCEVVRLDVKNQYGRDFGMLIERVISITPADVEQNLGELVYVD